MEHTEVYYRSQKSGPVHCFTGQWSPVAGGIVLFIADNIQHFIPFHMVVRIEQRFSVDVPANERYNKSLYNRMRTH